MKKVQDKNVILVIVTLGLLSIIGPFSIDMYLPGFKDVAESLNTSIHSVGYSLTSYFIGISVGQLFYGPILDRYGRKIPLYIGLIIFLVSSFFCAFAWDIDSLIVLRVFQAIGGCGGMVAARALIRDIFPIQKIAKIFSFIMLAVALSPLFAPTIGGFITASYGWEAIFILLGGLGFVALLATYFWLPEGNPPDKSISLHPVNIIRNYSKVAKVPSFYTFALATSVSQAGMFAYIGGSPFIFMEIYGVSDKTFGLIFAFIGVGMTAAGQLNILVLRFLKSEQITLLAICMQVLAGIAFVLGAYFQVLGLYSTIALIWFYMVSQGFIMPNGSALSLAPFSNSAGSASALMGALQLGFGAIATAIVSVFIVKSTLPIAVIMLVCASMAFVILKVGSKSIQIKTEE